MNKKLTIEQVADVLGYTEKTVLEQLDKHGIKTVEVGGKMFVTLAEVEKLKNAIQQAQFAALRELHQIEQELGLFDLKDEDYRDTISKLECKYHGLKIEDIGGVIPVKMNGTYEGLRIYARYRGDYFCITMGEDKGKDELPERDYYVKIENALGEPNNCFLTSEEFHDLFNRAFPTLLEEYSKSK